MPEIIKKQGQTPYFADDTRQWVEQFRVDGKLKPSVLIRAATDTNYILDRSLPLPVYGNKRVPTRSVMNLNLPCQRVFGITNWTVTEQSDNIISTASFEAFNCLAVSERRSTLTSTLPADYHSTTIRDNYILNSMFSLERRDGRFEPPSYKKDYFGYGFREERLKYRVFCEQVFAVQNESVFPYPQMPSADTDTSEVDLTYVDTYNGVPYKHANGVGAYYMQIDNEVIRVVAKSGGYFYIPPGGRAINGVLEQHNPGASVILLGFGPFTGDITAVGYLTQDDYGPQKAVFRPGTCLVSYEGWGQFSSPLTHTYDRNSNTHFTGYWFVTGAESSMGEDGQPKIKVDLKGPGVILDQQKISPDLLQRIKNQFGTWRVGQTEADAIGKSIWGAADHNRDIPSDWVDYNKWDPSLKDSYPLTIRTEIAQHKAFFDHMREFQDGAHCEICVSERKAWMTDHKVNLDELNERWGKMPANDPNKDKLGRQLASLNLQAARFVGRHKYKESIRVDNSVSYGPVNTWIRLMATLAAAAWEHPAYGSELSQRFSKIPNILFDNLRNIESGYVFNGQIDVKLESEDLGWDWSNPTYDDTFVVSRRKPLVCPFEASYDKAPFSQPMQDLADVNGASLWVNRRGFVVFVPQNFNFRPYNGRDESPSWFLSYGGSISAYSSSLSIDQLFSQVWVTCETAFEGTTFTSPGAGTGLSGDKMIMYSSVAGNKEALALSSGVQLVDTIQLDNQIVGLDWNTMPDSYGVEQVDAEGHKITEVTPPLYAGQHTLHLDNDRTNPVEYMKGKWPHRSEAVAKVQNTCNFFLRRRYYPPIYDAAHNKFWYTIDVDGKYGPVTFQAVKGLQSFLAHHTSPPAGYSTLKPDGQYGIATFKFIRKWFSENSHYIKMDIWWYVANGKDWVEYVAAVMGVPIPMKKNTEFVKQPRTSSKSLEVPEYVPDDLAMQKEVQKWLKNYVDDAVNVANRRVNESVDAAIVRSLSTNIADPRIQPGDTIWAEVPGFLTSVDVQGRIRSPFKNGIYVTSVSRVYDQTGTYTATYSGHRVRSPYWPNTVSTSINQGYDFING